MVEKDRADLQKILKDGRVIKPAGVLPNDVVYSPPQGKILEDEASKTANRELLFYVPTTPTPQTDLLQSCERQFVLPIIMPLSMLFRSAPITDDIYRLATEEMKESSLFCIISRSNVRRLENGFIFWTPFVVVIKQRIVVQLKCAYHPTQHQFRVLELDLWQNNTGSYYVIKHNNLQDALPGIIEKYISWEGILRSSGE